MATIAASLRVTEDSRDRVVLMLAVTVTDTDYNNKRNDCSE